MESSCDAVRIAERVRDGDLDALGQISRCYGERLMAVGLRRCRDRADAEDAVQDALLSAGGALQGFRGDGSVEGWLTRMVINACYRMRRGQKNDRGRHDTDTELPDNNTPEDGAARSQLARLLEDALAMLSPLDQAVVILSDVEGWSAPQIAMELTMQPGTVRVRLHRARKKLRTILASLPDETRIFVGHDYQPGGRELAFENTIGASKVDNYQLTADMALGSFRDARTTRDAALPPPKFIFQSVQINIAAGHLPEPERNGHRYLKLPIGLLG